MDHMVYLPDPFEGADEILRDMRREVNATRETLIAAKKGCEQARDIDGARILRALAADAMRAYRAICFVAPYFMAGPLPGDCKAVVAPRNWPEELASEIRFVLGRLHIA